MSIEPHDTILADSPSLAILDAMQDAVYIINDRRQILYWNEGAHKLYGWSLELAIGQNVNNLLYAAESDQFDQALETLQTTGSWSGEHCLISMLGKEVVAAGRWSPLEGDGFENSILIVNTDITEQKKLASQSLRNQRLESLGNLASGIAHDMNNILGPILVSVQLLKMQIEDEQVLKIIQTLEASTRRGAELLKQVLAFARGVEGQYAHLDVPALLEEIRQLLESTFPKSVQLSFSLPEEIWHIRGDMTQLHQVVMNLCVNARDAISGEGQIRISARNVMLDESSVASKPEVSPGPYVRLSVSDNGCGMTNEQLHSVFEPFYTTKEHGTGLGLSTLLGIVRSHGGFVEVDSQLGEGTTFKVYLPAGLKADATRDTPANSITLQGRNRLLIVVDDEEAYRLSLENLLTKYGFRVLAAANGWEGAALFNKHRDEVYGVITDLMMPVMDGHELIAFIRDENTEAWIVAMSGGISESDWMEASDGADAFMPKPFEIHQLVETLTRLEIPDFFSL